MTCRRSSVPYPVVCVCEGNNIGDDGAIALSKVLPKNRSLKDVDLAGTGGSCCCYRSLL